MLQQVTHVSLTPPQEFHRADTAPSSCRPPQVGHDEIHLRQAIHSPMLAHHAPTRNRRPPNDASDPTIHRL
jgi:hypothetical protein